MKEGIGEITFIENTILKLGVFGFLSGIEEVIKSFVFVNKRVHLLESGYKVLKLEAIKSKELIQCR